MKLLFTKNLNSLKKGEKVLIIDDLLATGGTAEASARLVENIGGVIAGIGFVIKLTGFLHSREKLKKYSVLKLVQVEVHE